jgi:uncharacterized protein
MLVVVAVVLVVFAGALTRATFGFGEALVAMPLLALLPIGLPTAAALMGLVGLVIAAVSMLESSRDVDRRALLRLLAGTLAGIPLGLGLVLLVPADAAGMVLGVFLVGYGAYGLAPLRPVAGRPVGLGWAWPVGVVAGGLGSAYSFHGVPVVVYGTMRSWSPAVFRGTLQAFFLVSGLLVVTGQAVGGLWSRELFVLLAASLPAIAAAILLGRVLYARMPARRFQRYVHLLVLVLGLVLVGKVLLDPAS